MAQLKQIALFVVFTLVTLSHSARHDSSNEDGTLEAKIKEHDESAIDSLIRQDDLIVDSKEAQRLHRVDQMSSRLRSSYRDLEDGEHNADIPLMNKTFVELFSKPRNDVYDLKLKDQARTSIMDKFKEYDLETFTQTFKSRKSFQTYRGTNIIGIKAGKYRGTDDDQILVLGCHYDTVQTSPGVDDNASGLVAILEVARLLHANGKSLDHTVIFVAFDLEEVGLLGSIAFVRDYLIPTELTKHKAKFIGAYVIDMMLSYETVPNSQRLPNDIASGLPHVKEAIDADKNRGNFVALWSRRDVDNALSEALLKEWKRSNQSSIYKLIHFDAPLPAQRPSNRELRNLGTFTRSDHAAFWYHETVNYPDTLNAVLLTDMGPWRGLRKKCYHNWCDDTSQLTMKNLQFYKHTVDALYNVIANYPPKYKTSQRTPRRPPLIRRFFQRVRRGRSEIRDRIAHMLRNPLT